MQYVWHIQTKEDHSPNFSLYLWLISTEPWQMQYTLTVLFRKATNVYPIMGRAEIGHMLESRSDSFSTV